MAAREAVLGLLALVQELGQYDRSKPSRLPRRRRNPRRQPPPSLAPPHHAPHAPAPNLDPRIRFQRRGPSDDEPSLARRRGRLLAGPSFLHFCTSRILTGLQILQRFLKTKIREQHFHLPPLAPGAAEVDLKHSKIGEYGTGRNRVDIDGTSHISCVPFPPFLGARTDESKSVPRCRDGVAEAVLAR